MWINELRITELLPVFYPSSSKYQNISKGHTKQFRLVEFFLNINLLSFFREKKNK